MLTNKILSFLVLEKKKRSRYQHNIRVHRHTAPSSRRSKHITTAPAAINYSTSVSPTAISPPAVLESMSTASAGSTSPSMASLRTNSQSSHDAFQTIQAHVSSMAAAVAAANTVLLQPWFERDTKSESALQSLQRSSNAAPNGKRITTGLEGNNLP